MMIISSDNLLIKLGKQHDSKPNREDQVDFSEPATIKSTGFPIVEKIAVETQMNPIIQ